MQYGRDHRCWGVSAHAAGVGASVLIQQTLVILAGRHGQHVLTIHQHDKAGFLAKQTFLDHHARAGFAQLLIAQHHVDSCMCFSQGLRHHHAFACSKTIRLDDDGRALLVDIRMRICSLCKRAISSRWNAMPQHESLGEIFRGLELCRRLRRAENF